MVELHTSEYANGPQTASISGGVEIYNESGLRVVAKCIESDKSEYALETMIFIDNQSEESFYIKVDDFKSTICSLLWGCSAALIQTERQ